MVDRDRLERERTGSIIGAFFEVYNALGFGFLESVYLAALEIELSARAHAVKREVTVRVGYQGRAVATHRLDMVVDESVIVEVKSARALPDAAHRQVHNYLRATNLEVGLLLHFGPNARFYRMISANRGANPGDQ